MWPHKLYNNTHHRNRVEASRKYKRFYNLQVASNGYIGLKETLSGNEVSRSVNVLVKVSLCLSRLNPLVNKFDLHPSVNNLILCVILLNNNFLKTLLQSEKKKCTYRIRSSESNGMIDYNLLLNGSDHGLSFTYQSIINF